MKGISSKLLPRKASIILVIALMSVGEVSVPVATARAERFDDVEIRVIRPKYFTKHKRFELGAQLSGIMNETFIYTFLASGLATYHFSEAFAFEGAAGYALSVDKEDKRILFDEFEIKTKIFRATYLFWGSLLWTPIYGKWQLPSGSLIYFDTFLSAGLGQTGIEWRYSDFCEAPDADDVAAGLQNDLPPDTVIGYNTLLMGLGQRYFLDKKSAIRWDIRGHFLMYERADAECDPESGEAGGGVHNNITLSLGMSRFF